MYSNRMQQVCMHSNARMQFTVHATYIIYALLSPLYCIMSTCLKVRPCLQHSIACLQVHIPYSWKFSPGENFHQLHHLFSWWKFYLWINSRANDCIEDIMVTFIMLVKILSVTYSCGTKVAGLGEIFLLQNICAIQYVASYVTGAQQTECSRGWVKILYQFGNMGSPYVLQAGRLTLLAPWCTWLFYLSSIVHICIHSMCYEQGYESSDLANMKRS